MTQSSALGYWEYAQPTLLNADAPMSCGYARRIANNIDHLYDEQTQHRVNWASSGRDISDHIGLSSGSGRVYWETVVPWTMKRNRMPVNVDYRVAAATTNAAVGTTVSIKMVPWWADYNAPVANTFFTSATSAAETSTTGAWSLSAQKIFTSGGDPPVSKLFGTCLYAFDVKNDDAEVQTVSVPLVKFVVTATNETWGPHIMGVLVREFV
jgi:hypothetical protein